MKIRKKEAFRNFRLTIKNMMREKNLRIREEKRQKKAADFEIFKKRMA